ncbi:hypothetical protein [Phycicoccus avicenniae]|uniref:hypothetical protein n=1 Tax=Phycicoccus avicenniae TaxID=2828860 RepID=UPI003D2A30A4
MPGVILSSPHSLAVAAPDGTTVTLALGDGTTATGSVTGGIATFTATPGTVIRSVMVGDGSYFDGDSAGAGGKLIRWTGAPGASASEEYTPGLGPFTTDPPPISYRFTGRIATPRIDFPVIGRSVTTITATDELAWQGPVFRKFIDVPGQEILSRGPVSLFRLVGGDLSDAVTNGLPAALVGTGTAPADSDAVVTAASDAHGTTFSGGRYVTGDLATEIDPYFPAGATLVATIRTTSSTPAAIASLNDRYMPKVILSLDAAGKVVASTNNPYFPAFQLSVTSAAAVNDGLPHVIAARWDNTGTLSLVVDQLAPVSASNASAVGPQGASRSLSIGGSANAATFTGTIANVAAFGAPLADAALYDIAAAALTGFQGETTAARLDRYNRWAGTPFPAIDATGATSQMGHLDTEGKGLTDCLDAVAVVEDGILHVAGNGNLVLVARASLYNQAPVFTIPGPSDGEANRLGDSLSYPVDPRDVINDITGTRPNGTTQRVINSTSADEYGWRTDSVEGPFVTDADLAGLLDWIINTRSTPQRAAEGVRVRLNQLDDAQTAALLAADIGKGIAWTGLPTQAPRPTDAGTVLGITETYSSSDLLWEVDAPPNPYADVWIIGDPVHGQIGTTHRIAH